MLRFALLAVAVLAVVAVPVAPAQPPRPVQPRVDPVPSPPLPTPNRGRGLDMVPRDAFAFATLDVARLADHPTLKPVRDFLTPAPGGDNPFARLLGVSPADIDRATLFVTHPEALDETVVVAVTTRQPYARNEVLRQLGVTWAGPTVAKRHGNVILPENGPFTAVVLADSRTLFYLIGNRFGRGDESTVLVTMGKLLARAQDGPLAAALAEAPKHAACVGVDIGQLADVLARNRGFPKDLAPLLMARSAVFTADLDGAGLKAHLTLTFPDDLTARQAVPGLEKVIEGLATDIDRDAKWQAERGESGAAAVILFRWLSWTLTTTKVKAEGNTVVAAVTAPVDDMIVKLMAKLPKSIEAGATNARATNNLKQIALAVHNFHDANARCPGNVYSPDGKPLLSWRVQLLPYLEQAPMFQQFRMNEAWDSPHNKALLEQMPPVFAIPGRPAAKGETYLQTFVSPRNAVGGRAWLTEGDRFGPLLAQIPDGTSNTIMVAEAGVSVPWTKPDDLPYGGERAPLPKLGADGSDRFLAAFGDGSVRSVRKTGNEQNVRAMITRDGGEVITADR